MDEFSAYYTLFNLRPEASPQDLKVAYKRLVKQWHPDRFASDPVNLRIAEEKIKTINIAYEALKARQESGFSGTSSSKTSHHTTSIKTRRTSPQDYFDAAKHLAKLGQYREAAEDLSHAIKLEQKYAAAYHLRGILFTILGFERRGGSDLRRAAVLGVVSLDYDHEVIHLVQTCDDFKFFRHLLKKDVDLNSEKTTRRSHDEAGSDLPNSTGQSEKFSPPHSGKSSKLQAENLKIKDIRQERQRQKQLKKEKLKQEKLQQEQIKRKTQASQAPRSDDTVKKSSASYHQKSSPTSKPVEEIPTTPQSKPSGFSVKIQAELDFSKNLSATSVIAISANGKTLAAGANSGDIDLWNYKNKRNFHTLKGHSGAVTQVAFSADNQILFSSGEDGTMRLWSLSDGSFIRSFLAHEGPATTFEVCHLRKLVITAGADGVVRVWDLRESKLLREILHHESSISTMILNGTGEVAVCGVADGSIRCCHVLRGGIVNWFTAHTQAIQTLAFSQDNQTFASGSSNGDVSLWQFPSGERRQVCQSAQSGMTALTFCHQGRLLCGADDQGHLMVWDVASGALLDTVSAHSPGRISLITVADDALISAGADGAMRQWRL